MADQIVQRETLSITTTNVTQADKALGAQFNRVAFRALQEANTILEYGTPQAKLTVVRAFIPSLAKLSTVDQKEELSVMRQGLTEIMDGMKQGINTLPEAPIEIAPVPDDTPTEEAGLTNP